MANVIYIVQFLISTLSYVVHVQEIAAHLGLKGRHGRTSGLPFKSCLCGSQWPRGSAGFDTVQAVA